MQMQRLLTTVYIFSKYMIKVKVISILPFAVYEDTIYSYKVNCELGDGAILDVLDENPFDLGQFVEKEIYIEFGSHFIKQTDDSSQINCFYGSIINGIDEKSIIFKSEWIDVELPSDLILDSGIKVGEKTYYCFEEIFIKAFRPCTEV